jgi:uncharacterized protein (DUF433 family)
MPPSHKNISQVYSRRGRDLREAPAYTITEAARHLRIPLPTLRSWVKGRYYPIGKEGEQRFFEPAIVPADPQCAQLSFINLIEAHVLDAMRRQHKVPFYNVRRALETLKQQFPSKHPLADNWFQTDGYDLFIEDYLDRVINLSQSGQIELKELIEAYLKRIDRDVEGVPTKLYPVVKTRSLQEPPLVVIDPLVSFGRPVLVGSGIPTSVLAERFYAGDSTDVLAKDYGRERSEIEEAVQYEAPTREAA